MNFREWIDIGKKWYKWLHIKNDIKVQDLYNNKAWMYFLTTNSNSLALTLFHALVISLFNTGRWKKFSTIWPGYLNVWQPLKEVLGGWWSWLSRWCTTRGLVLAGYQKVLLRLSIGANAKQHQHMKSQDHLATLKSVRLIWQSLFYYSIQKSYISWSIVNNSVITFNICCNSVVTFNNLDVFHLSYFKYLISQQYKLNLCFIQDL